MDAKPRVFLHVGQGKTGTTTVQGFLSRHRAELLQRGYLYPTISGHARHGELTLYTRDDASMVEAVNFWRVPWETPAEVRAVVEGLPAQIADSGAENVVLSDEGLWRRPPRRLATLISALKPAIGELVFVIYLRRQDEHVVSRYKQTMREGKTALLSEFVARRSTFEGWQYDATLRDLSAAFPDARMVVRPYHRSRFRERSLVQDFLDAIEVVDLEYDREAEDQLASNTSFDAYTTEFLRRHNAANGRAAPRLRRLLTDLSDGPDLRMEDEEHRALWEQFIPSNTRLVEEFAPGTEDVFLSPPVAKPGITQREVTDEDLARVEARLAEAATRGTSGHSRRGAAAAGFGQPNRGRTTPG